MNQIPAIILAAGKGTRLKSKAINKVMLPLSGKPMLARTVQHLENAELHPIIIVVGFAREDVIAYFGENVLYAIQEEQLGTANATSKGLELLPTSVDSVLVVNGDDSYNFSEELLSKLIDTHYKEQADITLMTIETASPTGLGRIKRDENGLIYEIVEEKDATEEEKKITEVNPQCWVFKRQFLLDTLPKIEKNSNTGEYLLTDTVKIAIEERLHVHTVKAGHIPWRGVNTPEELENARSLVK